MVLARLLEVRATVRVVLAVTLVALRRRRGDIVRRKAANIRDAVIGVGLGGARRSLIPGT